MSNEAILVTIVSSLISGIIGVAISTLYFYKLERHKLKLDLARRIMGNRYSISGDAFSCAMNEVIVVFADSKVVLEKMERFFEALQAPGKPNAEATAVDFFKAISKASGLSQEQLNDTYLIKTFNARN